MQRRDGRVHVRKDHALNRGIKLTPPRRLDPNPGHTSHCSSRASRSGRLNNQQPAQNVVPYAEMSLLKSLIPLFEVARPK
jgi:hypothetical protein